MMTAAALTPRVRLMAVCDGVRESKTEAGAFHLTGVRQVIMKNKSRKTLRKPTLQDFVLEPITELAEQAALDRRCRQAEKVRPATAADSGKPKSSKRR